MSPWPTLWPQRSRWHLWSVWQSLWPQKVKGSLKVALTYFMTQWPLWSIWPSLWPQKVKGSWEVTVTYFMTSKVTVTFVLGLTEIMTPKGHLVIRGRSDLFYDPKGHVDLFGWFDLVYHLKRSRGHERSPWPTLWPQRSWWPLWSIWPSLWPQKVTRSLEVTVTFFISPKVTVTFVVGLT